MGSGPEDHATMASRQTKNGKGRSARSVKRSIKEGTDYQKLGVAGAAILSIDGSRQVLMSTGWEKVVGSPVPSRIPTADEAGDDLVGRIAETLGEAEDRRRPVRRLAAIDLDRRRYFAITAGQGEGGNGGGASSIVVFEVPNVFKVQPKEGEEIRQLAHDLRTPLTSMSGAVELLHAGRMGKLNPEQDRLLGMLQKGIDMMLTLIDKATDDYRREAGRIPTDPHKAAN